MRLAATALLALALGALAGRATAPSPNAALPPPSADPSPGPTRTRAGVGVGFAHSRAGAVLAAGTYQQAFADPAVLRPALLRRRVEAVATPGFAPQMLAANRPGARRLAASAFGRALREGSAAVFLGVPLTHRLLSYSPRRAVVELWGFTLLGDATETEPLAFFGLGRTVLVWRGGDWKIASTRASFGPTPRLASPRAGGEGPELVSLAGEPRYGLAP